MNIFTQLYGRIIALPKKLVVFAAIVFLAGAFTAFAARFILVDKSDVHYHANFAVYVDGVREPFESLTFYEEIAACSDSHNNPKGRVHMHDKISHVVHVHDDAVTWGQFFENISYSISRESLLTDKGLLVDGQNNKTLTYVLNGKKITNPANTVINSEDVLLVDYSRSTAKEIDDRYAAITKDAAEYNKRDDPSACQGGADEPFMDRVLRTLGVETTH